MACPPLDPRHRVLPAQPPTTHHAHGTQDQAPTGQPRWPARAGRSEYLRAPAPPDPGPSVAMTKTVIPILLGFDYQARWFWCEALRLLRSEPLLDRVAIEAD